MTPQVSTCPDCQQPMHAAPSPPFVPRAPDGGPAFGIWWCANGHPRIERMRDDEDELMKPHQRMKPYRGDSLSIHVADATRGDLVRVLAEMPEDAFGWLVLALLPQAMLHGARAQIWPDGIGGFSTASRASIEAARAAATAYLDAFMKPPIPGGE